MSGRKRASGPVRAAVLAALRDAVNTDGPLCFTSKRHAARVLAERIHKPPTTIMRALAHPETADLVSAIEAAIQPRDSFATQGVSAGVTDAGFGSDPVVIQCGDPVSDPGDPDRCVMQPSNASPLVDGGDPVDPDPGPSRAREPRCSTSSALLSSAPPEPGPPITTSLGRRPVRLRPSAFDGECSFCSCGLDVGEAFMLVPYARKSGAVLFCMDCADLGLELAQLEWDLAHPPTNPPTPTQP